MALKLMVAMALLASSSSAQAQWELLDDFEGLDTGPLEGQVGWTVTNPGVYEVADDLLGSGNKVLYVPTGSGSGGGGAGSNNASIFLGAGIADGDTGTAFFRMSIGKNNDPVGSGLVGADFVFGASDIATPEGWSNYEGYMVLKDGNFRVRNGGNFDTIVGTNYVPDEWYNIWLVLDNAANETSLYSSQGTDPAVFLGTGDFRNTHDGPYDHNITAHNVQNDPLVTLNLRIGELLNGTDGQLDSIYFDPSGANLSNPIPEPTSLVLAAGCFLLAGASRRRRSR